MALNLERARSPSVMVLKLNHTRINRLVCRFTRNSIIRISRSGHWRLRRRDENRCFMKIGDLAKRSGLSAHTLRYYERIGLLPYADRDRSGQRDHDASILTWIEFLGRLKTTGMPIRGMLRYAKLVGCGDEHSSSASRNARRASRARSGPSGRPRSLSSRARQQDRLLHRSGRKG